MLVTKTSLRKLTADEIEKFAARKDVRRVAVENFLGTVHNNENAPTARANLYYDADLYKWNHATIKAIEAGINLAAKPQK